MQTAVQTRILREVIHSIGQSLNDEEYRAIMVILLRAIERLEKENA